MMIVGPFSLVIVPLYEGPLLEVKHGTETEGLATLLNHALGLPESGLAEAIEQRCEGSNMITAVTPAEGDEDDRALREAWAARTGEQLEPGAVAHVWRMGHETTLPVPWALLSAALTELRARRAAWSPDPGPWLFTCPVIAPFLTPEDHALLRRLEAGAAAIDALDLDVAAGQEPRSLVERRQAFLRECRAAGIFARDHASVREQWLHAFKRLYALRKEATQLRDSGLLAPSDAPGAPLSPAPHKSDGFVVTAGPYSLVLVPSESGALFEVNEGAETEALARLLNHAVEPPDNAIGAALYQGSDVSDVGDALVYRATPDSDEEMRALCAAWAAFSGEPIEEWVISRLGMAGRGAPILIDSGTLNLAHRDLGWLHTAWRPDPGPWLFSRGARSAHVTPDDRALLRRLEAEAGAIDALTLDVELGREPPALIERRRAFLLACRDAGIFALDHGEAREQWLGCWELRRLVALRDAAAQLRAIGLLGEGEEPPDGAACVDYTRLLLWPDGKDTLRWPRGKYGTNGAAWARSALALIRPDLPGEQGTVVLRAGRSSLRAWWRRDGTRPALLAITSGPGVI